MSFLTIRDKSDDAHVLPMSNVGLLRQKKRKTDFGRPSDEANPTVKRSYHHQTESDNSISSLPNFFRYHYF